MCTSCVSPSGPATRLPAVSMLTTCTSDACTPSCSDVVCEKHERKTPSETLSTARKKRACVPSRCPQA